MNKTSLSLIIALTLASALVASASGPIAVYALVDKVVMEPNESAPDRVQIWGAFSLQTSIGNARYSPAERGYLYYKIDTSICSPATQACKADIEKTTRAIFSDLKKKAGTGQAVGFGGTFTSLARGKVRKSADKPDSPDAFPWGNPVTTLGASQSEIAANLKAALQSR